MGLKMNVESVMAVKKQKIDDWPDIFQRFQG